MERFANLHKITHLRHDKASSLALESEELLLSTLGKGFDQVTTMTTSVSLFSSVIFHLTKMNFSEKPLIFMRPFSSAYLQ